MGPETHWRPPVPRPSGLVIPAVASGAGYRMRSAAIVTMVLLISGAVAVALWHSPEGNPAQIPATPPPIPAAGTHPLEVRVLAGPPNGGYTPPLGPLRDSARRL